jgi:catecholate siderophore receptor
MTGIDQATPAQAQTAPADAQTAAVGDASPQLTAVTVSGVRALLGDKIPLDLQDTPQSVNVIPLTLMQEQADHRLEDALKNVPGVTLNAGEGAARGDTVNIRGFSAFNDFFLDGIRDAGIYTRDVFDLETLEVLKGPSAILFGRGSTGGVINQVTKAAQMDPIQAATLQTGTNDEVRGTGDFDMPIGP